MPRADSRLIEVRGPTAEEVTTGGAEIVFVRKSGDRTETIFAMTDPINGPRQWGADYQTLSDNWDTLQTWHNGMVEVFADIRDDEDDEDEDDNQDLIDEGYTVEETSPGTYQFRDPVGDLDEDNYGSQDAAWEGAREDYVRYRK